MSFWQDILIVRAIRYIHELIFVFFSQSFLQLYMILFRDYM